MNTMIVPIRFFKDNLIEATDSTPKTGARIKNGN